MDFEVYCDECHQDVISSANPKVEYLMIGSLWLPSSLRSELKESISELRAQHNVWGEIKWTKVSSSRIEFYLDLVDLFFSHGENLRFRCIAVSNNQFDKRLCDNDEELGFYKFYYQLLHHWILDFNEYNVFCDKKSNRDPKRLSVLGDCLSKANLTSEIRGVQSLPSGEVVLIQLCDLLLGAASSRVNNTLRKEGAKFEIVSRLENALGREICSTTRDEDKFNVFKIRLQGGW